MNITGFGSNFARYAKHSRTRKTTDVVHGEGSAGGANAVGMGINALPDIQGDVEGGPVFRNYTRYKMYGDFLVDGETGDAWKYDQETNRFLSVPREENEIGKLKEIVEGYDLIDQLQSSRSRISQEVHPSELKKYETAIDRTVNVIGKRVDALLSEIT